MNANLGPIVSELQKLLRKQQEVWDDPMGCIHEVANLVVVNHGVELELFAQQHGFKTIGELVRVIKERTSYRWVYFNLHL